jgi:hypothetical protein
MTRIRPIYAGKDVICSANAVALVQFLWQDDLLSVARFIADCFDHFQSGGDPSYLISPRRLEQM